MNKKALKKKFKPLLKKMSPNTKRQIKKMLGMKVGNSDIIYHAYQWVNKYSKPLEQEVKRDLGYQLETNIIQEKVWAMKSQAKDKFIEQKLQSKYYTFRDMLLIKNPYEFAPLTALAIFYTRRKYSVRFTINGDKPEDTVTATLGMTNFHRVPIFGLYPERKNIVLLELLDKNGKVRDSRKIKIRTDSLPEDLKDMIYVEKYCGHSAFNLTFISGGLSIPPLAFDSSGQIRYYLSQSPKGYGVFPISKGRFLYCDQDVLVPSYTNPHAAQISIMDMFGRVFKTYMSEKGTHHDACEKVKDGNLLLAGSSLDNGVEDAVIEIDRETGKPVKELFLRDIFDNTYKDRIDWAHINTISYDEETNSILICLRNLHSALKIDWDTNEIKWILADPKFWKGTAMEDKVLKPISKDIMWHYQSHAFYELKEDLDQNPDTKHYIIFDNHWHKRRKVKFFDNNPNSFVRIYTVNEKEKTVKMERQYEGYKSKIRSNGILVKDRNSIFSMSGYLEPKINDSLGMISEYDYTTGEIINQYRIVKGFYRAYEFLPDYGELAKPMPVEKNYLVGDLVSPIKVSKDEVKDANLFKSKRKVEYYIKEDILYVKAKDHKLKAIYFVSENKDEIYKKDYSKTEQIMPELFSSQEYYMPITIADLDKDSYKIYINYEDKIYETKVTFCIK